MEHLTSHLYFLGIDKSLWVTACTPKKYEGKVGYSMVNLETY